MMPSYSDGAELRCSQCGEICMVHYQLGIFNDVCSTCVNRAAPQVGLLIAAGATQEQSMAYRKVIG